MSKYEEVISALRKAKSAHIRWRSYAYGIVSGLDITEEYTPLEHTDCQFGKWFYGPGGQNFSGLDTYQGLEVPHKILHDIYKKIHKMASAGDLDGAQKQAENLTQLSRQLIEAMELLEKEAAKTGA